MALGHTEVSHMFKAKSGRKGNLTIGCVLGLIPKAKFVEAVGEKGQHYADVPQMFCGKDTHILLFPIDKNETVNVVAFHTDRSLFPQRPSLKDQEPWIQSATNEDMISHFSGWGKDMLSLLNVSAILTNTNFTSARWLKESPSKCMENPKKWALHQLIPTLDSYNEGNVCIAGDAA